MTRPYDSLSTAGPVGRRQSPRRPRRGGLGRPTTDPLTGSTSRCRTSSTTEPIETASTPAYYPLNVSDARSPEIETRVMTWASASSRPTSRWPAWWRCSLARRRAESSPLCSRARRTREKRSRRWGRATPLLAASARAGPPLALLGERRRQTRCGVGLHDGEPLAMIVGSRGTTTMTPTNPHPPRLVPPARACLRADEQRYDAARSATLPPMSMTANYRFEHRRRKENLWRP